jgi:outer membrane protein TolC
MPPAPNDTVLLADSAAVALDTVPLVPDTTIALADAIAGAMRTSPVTAVARAGVRNARSTERVAFGEFLPSAVATGVWYHDGTPSLGDSPSSISVGGANAGTESDLLRAPLPANPTDLLQQVTPATPTTGAGLTTGPYNNAYVNVAAGIDIFTAGRRPADNAWARALSRAAHSTETEQTFLVIGSVKTAYYNVMRDEDLEDVARAQVKRAGEDLRAAQHRRAVGAATPADVLQFELNLNTARQQLLQAITNRRSDAYALGRLAGIEGPAEAQRGAPLDPTPLALSDTAVIALAVMAAPTLVAAVDSARAANAAVWAARTQYLPTVRLGGGYTAVRTVVPGSTIQPGWQVQLGTVFPLFNGFVREDQVERTQAAREVARITARDAERNARAQAEALLGGVRLAAEQIRLARVSHASAQENYRVEQSRYGVGAATVLDLAVAEESLAQAEQLLVNARYDYQLARANLETLVGRDL